MDYYDSETKRPRRQKLCETNDFLAIYDLSIHEWSGISEMTTKLFSWLISSSHRVGWRECRVRPRAYVDARISVPVGPDYGVGLREPPPPLQSTFVKGWTHWASLIIPPYTYKLYLE